VRDNVGQHQAMAAKSKYFARNHCLCSRGVGIVDIQSLQDG
jgi:hypothetical protein